MVLVDTSVWVAHLRAGNIGLERLLTEGRIVCHPFIIGELACGNLKNRSEILALLRALPSVVAAEHEEVMGFIEDIRLMGKGLGLIDVHLLVSAILSEVRFWTLDKKLSLVASKLGLIYTRE
jgi:hypothetical protein